MLYIELYIGEGGGGRRPLHKTCVSNVPMKGRLWGSLFSVHVPQILLKHPMLSRSTGCPLCLHSLEVVTTLSPVRSVLHSCPHGFLAMLISLFSSHGWSCALSSAAEYLCTTYKVQGPSERGIKKNMVQGKEMKGETLPQILISLEEVFGSLPLAESFTDHSHLLWVLT